MVEQWDIVAQPLVCHNFASVNDTFVVSAQDMNTNVSALVVHRLVLSRDIALVVTG